MIKQNFDNTELNWTAENKMIKQNFDNTELNWTAENKKNFFFSNKMIKFNCNRYVFFQLIILLFKTSYDRLIQVKSHRILKNTRLILIIIIISTFFSDHCWIIVFSNAPRYEE